LKRNIFLALLILLSFNGIAQTVPDSAYINITHIENVKSIEDHTGIFFDSSRNIPISQLMQQPFKPFPKGKRKIHVPGKLVTRPVYLRFSVQNNSRQETSFYYCPGSLYSKLILYKYEPGKGLQEIYDIRPYNGYVFLHTAPGEKATFVVKGEFCRSSGNNVESRIMTPEFYPYFKVETEKVMIDKKVVGIILSGALCMMILFTLVNYLLNKKMEFLFNCLYSLCMFILIFFTAYLSRDSGWLKVFFIGYLDLLLLIIGTICYLAFTRKFLNTSTVHPKLDKFLVGEEWLLAGLMGLYSILHFFTDNYVLQSMLENLMKIIILAAALIFVVIALIKRNVLMNYLAIGTAVQIFFYIVSLFLILKNYISDSIFTSPIFYFELGVVMAVFFFLLGLTYKNKSELILKIKEQEAMKLEVEKKGFETQLAVLNAQQEERNRISADMHDDLGAGMTTIRLYSELAKSKLGDNVIPEIEKISDSASELVDKMNAIIWSMSSSNDTLGNMIAYIRSYALEYLEDSNLIANVVIPAGLPEIEVVGKMRRNIFLVVKEALHNIVKHAQATRVDLIMLQHENGFSLIIHDNGKGIDLDNIRTYGNGLKNMKKRMDDVNIRMEIENDNGTVIRLHRELKGLFAPPKGKEQ